MSKYNSEGINKAFLESTYKNDIREDIMNSHLKPNRIFTFGGLKLIDVKKFTKRFGFCNITSIERDPKVWKEQCKKIRGIYGNVNAERYEFHEYIDRLQRVDSFDIYYLDFNCIYSSTIENDMMKFFKMAKLEKDNIVGITFCKAHDGQEVIKNTRMFNELCGSAYSFYKENRNGYITQALKLFADESGVELKVIKQIDYKNNVKSAPMIFIMFKVLKNNKVKKEE